MNENISAVILTKNSEQYLYRVLKSLQELNEIVILDNGSTDNTIEIALRFDNVCVHKHDFIGFGPMKQLGASLAKNDWIFSLDSDEIASKELINELKNIILNEKNVYSYDVQNYYKDKLITCCGWNKDRTVGIYNKKYANFDCSPVHEKVISLTQDKLNIVALHGWIEHHPFDNAAQFLHKIKLYGELYAEQYKHKKKSSPFKALFHALWCFVKNYFLQKGIFCGYEGFIVSSYNAQGVFWKYILLYEANKQK